MKKYLNIILAFIFFGCGPSMWVQTSARIDPFNPIKINDKTFSFVFRAEKNDKDPLIEKQLLFSLQEQLIKKGWQNVDENRANILFQIDYEISRNDKIGSKTVVTKVPGPKSSSSSGSVYQSRTANQQTAVTEKQYSYSTYSRVIKIQAFQKSNMVWSADVVSEGKTNDIQKIGKYLISNAILKFPSEGSWRELIPLN